MTTKQRILKEALALFSEKGYSAVFVGEIADAVGIKAPSLYKHYKSKQDIFNACVEVFSERMQQIRTKLHLPDTADAAVNFQTASMEAITQIANDLFAFYLQDDVAAGFRKMLLIERYHNPELNKLYEDLFIVGAVQHEEKIFSALIDGGIIRKADPHIVTLHFYTPIFYLLQKYDLYPERLAEAKQELTLLVQEFCMIYGTQVRPR